jgi:hypothetical protein
MTRLVRAAAILAILSLVIPTSASAFSFAYDISRPFRSWTLEEAIEVLTQSPWARQETFTRVVGGIGSGVLGEKEIYTTFYVRFLSAPPVREAYARVQQIQAGYDAGSVDEKKRIDASLGSVLKLDSKRWIIVAVGFRSNDSSIELALKEFFDVQTSDSIRSKAHLSTALHPQVEPVAYFGPREEAVGAKFVFPRKVEGEPIVTNEAEAVTFELSVPGFERDVRVTFPVTGMVINGEPVL